MVCKEGKKVNKCDLKNKLSNILDSTKSISLFLVLNTNDGISIKKADIENGETTNEINELFRNRIREITTNEEIGVINLSSADERANVIYEYDYDEYPDEMLFIKNFDIKQAVNYELFSFAHDSLRSLIGYLIYIGDMNRGIVCFKKHYAITMIKRGSFLIYKHRERFKKLDAEDIIRLNNDIGLFKLENKIFVLDVNIIEKYFGFEELIRKRASITIDSIENKGIIENVNALKNAATDFSFSKKLSKIAEQSLIITQSIPNDKIIEFSKTHPGLKGKFSYSNTGSKIVLKSKSSQIAFLKLLNDDFLISELTNQPYDSLAKDRITT